MLEAFDSERFEVQSYYRVLAPSGSDDCPWKGIWKPFVPNNVAFSFGLLIWGISLQQRI